MNRGLKGSEAELLAQKWLQSEGWLVHRARPSSLVTLPPKFPGDKPRTFCQSHDVFGCLDLIAISATRGTWAWQVTSASSASAKSDRRRKIEAVEAWPSSWRVSLVTHERTPDPANRARSISWWRVEDYTLSGLADDGGAVRAWSPAIAIRFDPREVEEYARECRAAEKVEARRD